MKFVDIGGQRIEVVQLASAHPRSDAPPIVFLHEGLGSVRMWRDFPQRVADATGCAAIVYSRAGYGRSTPLAGKRPVRYMHDEALQRLPALLDALDVEAPILFGHSDGASIALIYAGARGADAQPGDAVRRSPTALVAMAPHVMVEEISVESIAEAKIAYETSNLREKLAKHHADVDGPFRGWNDIWLDPAFRSWNIEEYLPAIRCPILAIQGEDDEYGTMEQVERIARGARDVDLVKLADCRHSPHKDQPEAVLAAVSEFVARVLDARDARDSARGTPRGQ